MCYERFKFLCNKNTMTMQSASTEAISATVKLIKARHMVSENISLCLDYMPYIAIQASEENQTQTLATVQKQNTRKQTGTHAHNS